jgi:hypothetical protein
MRICAYDILTYVALQECTKNTMIPWYNVLVLRYRKAQGLLLQCTGVLETGVLILQRDSVPLEARRNSDFFSYSTMYLPLAINPKHGALLDLAGERRVTTTGQRSAVQMLSMLNTFVADMAGCIR